MLGPTLLLNNIIEVGALLAKRLSQGGCIAWETRGDRVQIREIGVWAGLWQWFDELKYVRHCSAAHPHNP